MSDEHGETSSGGEEHEQKEESAGTSTSDFRAHFSSSQKEGQLSEMALRILEAAMTLFARKGYAATSVREIVQAAQVTNPMLYYYFESKEGLFYKLIELLFGEMEQQVRETLEATRGEPFKQRLRTVILLHMSLASEAPTALEFIYAVLFGPRDSRPDFDPLTQRAATFLVMFELFEQAMERGEFEPHEGMTTPFLVQQFFGMLNQYMLFLLVEHNRGATPDREPVFRSSCHDAGHVDRLIDFFLRGAGCVHDP